MIKKIYLVTQPYLLLFTKLFGITEGQKLYEYIMFTKFIYFAKNILFTCIYIVDSFCHSLDRIEFIIFLWLLITTLWIRNNDRTVVIMIIFINISHLIIKAGDVFSSLLYTHKCLVGLETENEHQSNGICAEEVTTEDQRVVEEWDQDTALFAIHSQSRL